MTQKVGQNVQDFETMDETLRAVVSIARKYQQDDSQGAPGEAPDSPTHRVNELFRSVLHHTS
jgi:hypothetical protein